MIHKNRQLIYMLLVLLTALMLSGCVQDNKDKIEEKMNEQLTPPSHTGVMTEQPAKTSMFTDQSAQPSATMSAGPQPTPLHAEGEYAGQIDNSSIEVILDGTTTVFRLSETTQMQIGLFMPGDTMGFDYTPNSAGQFTIVMFDDVEKKLIATFEGQMDPHTIEVITDNGFAAFQLTEDALTQVESFETGDRIQIVYFLNDQGQNVATALYLITK